jgi:hypothetical protein
MLIKEEHMQDQKKNENINLQINNYNILRQHDFERTNIGSAKPKAGNQATQ